MARKSDAVFIMLEELRASCCLMPGQVTVEQPLLTVLLARAPRLCLAERKQSYVSGRSKTEPGNDGQQCRWQLSKHLASQLKNFLCVFS